MNEHLIIQTIHKNDVKIFELQGRLDESSFDVLQKKYDEISESIHLILNLSKLKYISSSGIRSLFDMKNKQELNNKKMYLAEASENIIRIFTILDLWKSFTHYNTIDEAVKELSS
ncbi:MAG: STAS domain-containing protein [Leptospiraceae bacterium]|nr:STAS domain-containing protein [Leptospiraceae bacterium]MCK6380955.1 STAS domain-containing protein [Leptospiraceae bacterium]NUM40950.1 STAS domain-containing protein [Leptospiraceae bacterium]